MPAGSIVVDLLARTGAFDTSIDRSTKAAEKRMREMEKTFNSVGAKIGAAFGTYLTVQGVRSLLNGVDALNDLADATGASIEKLSALEDIAARTGTSFDTVGNAVVKFNQSLKGTDPDSKAGRALEMLGLRMEDLQKLDPADALHRTALALAGFADDGNKARLVQELFGKSTKEVAAFLKDLADQGQLVGTVTEEDAKQAEAFNQQLAQMAKNSKDLARSIAGELLPEVNALLKALREGGAFGAFLGLGDTSNPGKKLTELNDKLRTLRQARDDLDPKKGTVNKINDFLFGDVADIDRQIAALEKEQKFLKSLQQSAALGGGGDTSDALSRRLGSRPGLGTLTEKAKAGPKGPDPDADFKQYLNNLEQQIQKVGELTTMEKLLDDIRRGHLTVTPKQEAQLKALASEIDAEKDALRIAKERAEFRSRDNEAALQASRDIEEADRTRLRTLLDSGPAAQLEKQRKEMEYLAAAFEKGTISAEEFNDAATGYLHLTGDAVKETKSMTEELGLTFASAFENAIVGGEGLSSVFKGLLQDIARVILRMGAIEPLMKMLKESMGGSGGGGFDIGKAILSGIGGSFGGGLQASFAGTAAGSSGFGSGLAYGNQDLGGFLADGGPASAGTPYIVGERGPELFVPRTAGMVVPNHSLAGGGNLSIINQTTGRIDNVVEQRPSPNERVLILQQARQLVAADLHNANSEISQAMRRNFPVRRNR